MKLIIASNNAHKLTEMKAILAPFFDDVQSMREAGIEHETNEDGNAVKKARELAEISGCCAIADDSGLCVDALDGAPGIYSARFSGVHGDDKANNRLLLEKLEGTENRGAHYTSAICCVLQDGSKIEVEGHCEGKIGYEPVGDGGFGYDPIFMQGEKAFAQLSAEEKDAVSHRGKALRMLKNELEKYLSDQKKQEDKNADK